MVDAGTKVRLIGAPLIYLDKGDDFDLKYIEPGEVGVVAEMTERYLELRMDDDEFVIEFPQHLTGEGFFFTNAEEGVEWEVVTEDAEPGYTHMHGDEPCSINHGLG